MKVTVSPKSTFSVGSVGRRLRGGPRRRRVVDELRLKDAGEDARMRQRLRESQQRFRSARRLGLDGHGIAFIGNVMVGIGHADMKLFAKMNRLVTNYIRRIKQFKAGIGQQPDRRINNLAVRFILHADVNDIRSADKQCRNLVVKPLRRPTAVGPRWQIRR